MWKTEEGSSGRLLQLCFGYFFFYTIYSVVLKYFTSGPAKSMSEPTFAVYSTIAGSLVCLSVVLALRWYRLESNRRIQVAGLSLPSELLYIVPSGLCTAIIIPSTTLLYSLPISVMVAMVIMRGSVIIISRVVDEVQLRQGILQKNVRWEENVAVLFALSAVVVAVIPNVLSGKSKAPSGATLSMTVGAFILLAYLISYALRIYIMNYYKNTRGKGVKLDNNGFFALEQMSASFFLLLFGFVLYNATSWFSVDVASLRDINAAIATPNEKWSSAFMAGMVFGTVSFFSVFIFMFKGRTATFAGLVNRLTSLISGTAATLITWLFFGGKPTILWDWVALGCIFGAVAFLTRAEKNRGAPAAPASMTSPLLKPAV